MEKISKFAIIYLLITETWTIDVLNSGNSHFEIIMDRFEMMNETPNIMTWNVKIKKVNKIRSLVGYITLLEPAGNNWKVGVKTLKKQGGEYRYLPYALPPQPVCDFTAKDNYVYPDLAKGSDFPLDIANNCPLAIGNYSLYNVTFDFDNVPKGPASSGEYASEIIVHNESGMIATYRLYSFINNV